ncbi:MAG: bifunctional hydroxymethylpyrimidine kinase/phosphomethylpyrimidine kinase [Elusimicrobiota bacterium]
MTAPRALTVGGSDPSGGAGIQADLKTFAALGVYGMAAVAALTVQDSRRVSHVEPVPGRLVARQIEAAVRDMGADAVKTGMLMTRSAIAAAADCFRALRVRRLVVDPVMAAKDGTRLLDPDGLRALTGRLLPLALLVTPNIPEAESLAGMRIRRDEDIEEAARRIASLGPRAVLIKGGHRPGSFCEDVLCFEGGFERLRERRIRTGNTRGTGCALSAAVAAWLSRGADLRSAVRSARGFVAGAIRHSLSLGKGRGPLCHHWASEGE